MTSALRHWQTVILPTIFIILGALILMAAGGWTLGFTGLWAFSHLSFLPFSFRVAFGSLFIIAASFSVALPYCNFALPNFFSKALHGFGQCRANQRVYRLLATLCSGILFWYFREQTWHGDALLKLDLLSTTTIATNPYIWKEPLDSLLTYVITALVTLVQQPPEIAIALLSVGAGMVYVWTILWLANLLWDDGLRQSLFIIGMLALGSSLLWFGHIENYSLVTAATIVALALGIGYLRTVVPLWSVGLALGTAVSLHPQAAFVLPASIVLLCHDGCTWRRILRRSFVLGATTLIVPIVTSILLLTVGSSPPWNAVGYAGDPQLFLRLHQMVEFTQLQDALNNLLLVAPLFPLWLITGCHALIQRRFQNDHIFGYLALAALGMLIYHFTFQNDLPRYRDWDLYAIVGPVISLWGLYVLLGQLMQTKGLSRFVLPMLLFATFYTGTWIGVNYHFTLIRPNTGQAILYQRYQLVDLTTKLPDATVVPTEPICADPVGCERVALAEFVMPQDGDHRPTIFAHAPAQIAFSLSLPSQPTFLWLSPALDPEAWQWGGDGVTFRVLARHNEEETVLWSRHLTPENPNDLHWQAVFVALEAYRNQAVTIVLETHPGPANDSAADRAGWGRPWLMLGTVDERF